MGPVEVEESHRWGPAGGGRWGRQWRRRGRRSGRRRQWSRSPPSASRFRLRPPPRRPEPVPGNRHLRLLADDVASEPDPRSAGELEAEAGRLGDGRGEARGQVGRSRATRSVSARRARAARRRSRSATRAAVVPGSGRGGRSMTRRSTERPARSAPAIDRPSSSVSGVRTTSQSRPDAAGDRLDRVERAGEVQPGDDRAVGLGLSARRRASVVLPGAGVARGGRRWRCAAGRPGRGSRRAPGSRSGRSARRCRRPACGASSPPAAARSPAPRRPAAAAAPQRAWRDARAADTSGESAAIGQL